MSGCSGSEITFFIVENRLQAFESLLPQFNCILNVIRSLVTVVVHAVLNVSRWIDRSHYKAACRIVMISQQYSVQLIELKFLMNFRDVENFIFVSCAGPSRN